MPFLGNDNFFFHDVHDKQMKMMPTKLWISEFFLVIS